MAYHGSPQCVGCSAEDCVCCEVYIEEQADARSLAMYGPEEPDYDEEFAQADWDDDEDDEEDERQWHPMFDFHGGDMDGDHATGLASAGHGCDEDYGGGCNDGDY